ncbi:MAG: thiamine diphosphokinase [Anaerotignum faecicola]
MRERKSEITAFVRAIWMAQMRSSAAMRMRHARKLGIVPDYIVGDFDSTASEVLEYYKAKNIPIRQFPTRKNETDMELGIILALELGATDLVLFGGIGDRFDHTLANAHYLLSL